MDASATTGGDLGTMSFLWLGKRILPLKVTLFSMHVIDGDVFLHVVEGDKGNRSRGLGIPSTDITTRHQDVEVYERVPATRTLRVGSLNVRGCCTDEMKRGGKENVCKA